MTKQDKSFGHFGPIFIGGGFRINKSINRRRLYPLKRLTEFLNLNPKDKDKIIDFCKNYTFIPRGYKDFFKGFRREHKEIKQIALKLNKGQVLNQTEIKKIEKTLDTIRTKLIYLSNNELIEINEALGGNTNITNQENTENKTLIKNKIYQGTIVSLWEDLIKQFIENQDIKECPNCKRFFRLESKHKRKFCCDTCRNSYNKRRSDTNKKLKTDNDRVISPAFFTGS